MTEQERNAAVHVAHWANPRAAVADETPQYIVMIAGKPYGDGSEGYAVIYTKLEKGYIGVSAVIGGSPEYCVHEVRQRLADLRRFSTQFTLEREYTDGKGKPVSYVMRGITYPPHTDPVKAFTAYDFDLNLLYSGTDEEEANIHAELYYKQFMATSLAVASDA